MFRKQNKKVEQFHSWMRSKRYSENTIKTYIDAIIVFLNFFSLKSTSKITNEDVLYFNNEYILKRKLSSTYQNQFVSSLKLFFDKIEHKNIEVSLLHRPRGAKTLPNVLSKKEVKVILGAPTNQKHRMMLTLIYACGLRSGELIHLKPSDILSDRNLLHIKQAKGKKIELFLLVTI
ncbi:MAG TPA: phage integrase N-terminal SAM-like domain-containing protein [Chitinophagaceae bacterium]|nr:phage integrase N-terminal SAM-like domain-containing protein [Chitinophagaceae bacterium]